MPLSACTLRPEEDVFHHISLRQGLELKLKLAISIKLAVREFPGCTCFFVRNAELADMCSPVSLFTWVLGIGIQLFIDPLLQPTKRFKYLIEKIKILWLERYKTFLRETKNNVSKGKTCHLMYQKTML